MSHLLREEVHVALSPDRAVVTRMARGLKARVAERHAVPCDIAASDEAPWTPALASLEAALNALEGKRMDVSVVLSNHFVRYALVPWSDQLSNEEEEQAYVRHCFAETYGEAAQRWALRASAGGYGETRLASAIDHGLLEGLERATSARGSRLHSIRPYLMTAFNRWRRALDERAAWFAVAEPGRLCLSLLRQRCWCSVQAVKVGDAWPDTLRTLLQRELLAAEPDAERGTVYLLAPGHTQQIVWPGWTVQRLGPMSAGEENSEFPLAITNGE